MRPEFAENSAQGQNEIERCRQPDPILRRGAATPDRCQSPSCEPDDGSIQEVNFEVIQRAAMCSCMAFSSTAPAALGARRRALKSL
jgi:hypothetical protein